MYERGTTVIRARRKWLQVVVRDVLEAYPRPPHDRPRELAEFIEQTGPMRRRRARGRRIPPAPIQMADRVRPSVPPIDNETELAHRLGIDVHALTWFADVKGLQRRARPGPLHHYRYLWRPGRNGRARLLEAPKPRLREIQRTLLDQVLGPIAVHPAAHGFVPGRSAVTAAQAHLNARIVISMDLSSFFSNLTADRVYAVFRAAGYPQPVAFQLTGLCTTRTPISVLRQMPLAENGFRLRTLLRQAHLPQGAPTSPALANLIVAGLDRRLAGYALACDLVYTRYADDLTFSLPSRSARRIDPSRIVDAVTDIVRDERLSVAPDKTRVRRDHQRQVVTGIVVNQHPNLPRDEFDRLKALLHNAVQHGPESQNRSGEADFRSHLLGRIAWVEQLNPARAHRLRASFDRISWPELS
jgi:retron-type reverse transcriptase